MKKVLSIIMLLFFVGFAVGQILSDDKIWVTFADTATLLSSDKATTNTSINDILNEYDVTSIAPLFPFAKTPFLRHTYEVTTQKAESLYVRMSHEKGLFSLCERVYEPQHLYNPSDWMWHYTVSNNITDDWLWYLVKIQAADAWEITKGDPTIKIAVVDDGFDYQHPELQSKIDPPYDFYSEIQETTTSNHGTSVASILAAETADQGETSIGSMASIGYKSKIMVSQHYLPACLYASTVLHAEILSISWYHISCSSNEYFRAVEQEILNNGTLIVRAAGNGSVNCGGGRLYPFSGYEDDRVIVVSSTDFNDNHTSPFNHVETTSYYPEVDICAPGYRLMGAIHSQNGTVTWPYFGFWGGTSQSTPIVSGVCALIKSVNRCLTAEDIQDIIKQTADPIQDANLYPGMVGAGRINAYKAVSLAQNYHNNNDTITSNETWSTNSYRGGTVVIDSLATLTITGTLNCSSSARLIVRPGGKLVVDGGTLTSACPNELWQGIEVVGDRTKRQIPQWQGTVELKNGAVIENAHCGIHTGIQGNAFYATTGGIITADSAFFINNRRAVAFLSYTNHSPAGTITDNQSSFSRCVFTVDNNNLFSQNNASFIDHVTMWEVRGVKFLGCTFSNQTGEHHQRHHAIYAEDAGFKLDSYCRSSTIILPGCECPEAHSRFNTFSGFSTAVEALTTGAQHAVQINHALFSNNHTGVKIAGNHFTSVTRCEFDLDQVPIQSLSNRGLDLRTSTGYLVEGNTFSRSTYSDPRVFSSTGIYVDSSGVGNNSLHLNTFENLAYGIYVTRNNGNDQSGLQATCNDFDHNKYDIYMSGGSSMRSMQGWSNSGADNSFVNTQTNSFYNPGPQYISYFYSSGGNHAPYNVTPSYVALNSSATANSCAPTLCNGGWVQPRLAEFQSDMDACTGSTQPLSDIYYTAVRTLMSDTVLDLTELEQWHAAAQPIGDPYSLTETRFMEGYVETFTADVDDAEMANYAEFHALKLLLRGNNNDNSDNQDNTGNDNSPNSLNSPFINWYALTPAQIAQLQTIAERNTGRASVMAKGVLCFFHGICYEDDLLGDDNMDNQDNNMETRSAKVSQQAGETNLTVYPNPTDDVLFIELRGGAGIANMALYDLQGRVVGTRFIASATGASATVNMRDIPAGVYVLRVTDTDGKEYHRKIVRK